MAIVAISFTSDTTATPEDAKRVVEQFMHQIEFAVNQNYTSNDEVRSNVQTARQQIDKLLEPDIAGYEHMADDINDKCETNFDRYFSTILGNAIMSNRLHSYQLVSVNHIGSVKSVDKDENGEPFAYCIETSQLINGTKNVKFRFDVRIQNNKISHVYLTKCTNNLPVAHTTSQAHYNAAANYTNGNTSQAFNDYILAVQLNPKDGEAYYRLAVMYYRGTGCKNMSWKTRKQKCRECISKAKQFGSPRIVQKTKNFEEYINR